MAARSACDQDAVRALAEVSDDVVITQANVSNLKPWSTLSSVVPWPEQASAAAHIAPAVIKRRPSNASPTEKRAREPGLATRPRGREGKDIGFDDERAVLSDRRDRNCIQDSIHVSSLHEAWTAANNVLVSSPGDKSSKGFESWTGLTSEGREPWAWGEQQQVVAKSAGRVHVGTQVLGTEALQQSGSPPDGNLPCLSSCLMLHSTPAFHL